MLLEFATCGRPRPSTESLMMHVMIMAEKMTMKTISMGRLRSGRLADDDCSALTVAVAVVTFPR
jgi:hypothetical protein